MSNDFNEVNVYTGVPAAQEQGDMETSSGLFAPAVHAAGGTIMGAEQSRAVAEIQAALTIAQSRPRDEMRAFLRIKTACQRIKLAEQAAYAYKRGSSLVTGPSIRLAEVMAQCWGNLRYGFEELTRKKGESECKAYCWDLETNTMAERKFVVRHRRDKAGGPVELSQERDIYELLANQAQRRVRACILEVIPGDIVDMAQEECAKTIEKGGSKPIEDRARDMLVSFKELGVTQEMIEDLLQHSLSAIVPAEFVRLQQIYKSIRDGVASREEFFKLQRPARPQQQDENMEPNKGETEAPVQAEENKQKASRIVRRNVQPNPDPEDPARFVTRGITTEQIKAVLASSDPAVFDRVRDMLDEIGKAPDGRALTADDLSWLDAGQGEELMRDLAEADPEDESNLAQQSDPEIEKIMGQYNTVMAEFPEETARARKVLKIKDNQLVTTEMAKAIVKKVNQLLDEEAA